MIKKISPELNPQHYINATRYEVFEFIKKVDETDIMTETLEDEYHDDSVSYEEFKQMALEYVYHLIFGNNEIDEDYRNKVIDTYNREMTHISTE